jgi:hypothetical protein
MNDRMEEFEKELRESLSPLVPRGELAGRIGREIDVATGPRGARLRFLVPLAAAAAVLLALAVGDLFHPGDPRLTEVAAPSVPPEKEALAAFHPVDYTQYLLGVNEEEVVYLEEAGPVMPVRLYLLDEVVWQDPARRVVLEVTAPREEVVFFPLEIY